MHVKCCAMLHGVFYQIMLFNLLTPQQQQEQCSFITFQL
jgi:hypothetical protein